MCYEYHAKRRAAADAQLQQVQKRRHEASFWNKINDWVREAAAAALKVRKARKLTN